MINRREINHKAVVRDYTYDEILATRRLSIRMIRFYMLARIEAKSEMLQQQIVYELKWWKEHNEALMNELDIRHSTQKPRFEN